ncbi:hypothetical protein V8E52_005830 [Russula decolorans]
MLAKAVTHILKPNLKPIIWSPPSITHFRGRNPLPLLSCRFRIASSIRQNKPALSRPCSFLHHSSIPVSPAMSSKKPLDHYRLPTDVRPRHYDLTIHTDLEKEKFSGFVRIDLDIANATKVVTFNAAAELNLGPATFLVTSSSSELAPVETKFDAGTQRVTLIFTEDLPAGSKATLRVGFESALTDSMSGYYKSTWEKNLCVDAVRAITSSGLEQHKRICVCSDLELV